MSSVRAAVVLRLGAAVALIERRRDGHTYYLFPGGGVEEGETPEVTAAREAKEELGVEVSIGELVARSGPVGRPQVYYRAEFVSGTFGTGSGEELASSETSEIGSYTPRWIPAEDLAHLDVRPRSLATAIAAGDLRGVLLCTD